MRRPPPAISALLTFLVLAACSEPETPAAAIAAAGANHRHVAPRGGTPVVLGREACHLEFVLDPVAGKLSVYVLDGKMGKIIRVKAATFEFAGGLDGGGRLLPLHAVPNAATGETVGDTSQFEAQAHWLKTAATFDARLTGLEIRGPNYTAGLNYPRGHDRG